MEKLDLLTPRIHTSFVAGSLKYLMKAGHVGLLYGEPDNAFYTS